MVDHTQSEPDMIEVRLPVSRLLYGMWSTSIMANILFIAPLLY